MSVRLPDRGQSMAQRPPRRFGFRSSRTIATANEAGKGSPVRRYGAICCRARPIGYWAPTFRPDHGRRARRVFFSWVEALSVCEEKSPSC